MKIRIAVVTDDEGGWSVAGWYGASDEDMAQDASDYHCKGNAERISWVTADVPLPEPVADVAGEVEG